MVPANGKRRLDIGSDVEIGERVTAELREKFGEIVFSDGGFWRYTGAFWEMIDRPELRRAVHQFDGAIYVTPSGTEAAVQLGKGRVDSVLSEMGAQLAQPDFFADAPAGINCASGFIAFDRDGKPRLSPHHPDHRCRHMLPGHWAPGAIDPEDPPPESLLGRLLYGTFKGDPDAADKRKLLAEAAGSAAVGHGPKLRRPKAIVLLGELAENGKSQILDAIRGLLPASAVASVSAAKFSDDRHIVRLRAKLLNAADELSGSGLTPTSSRRSSRETSSMDVTCTAAPSSFGRLRSTCSPPIACRNSTAAWIAASPPPAAGHVQPRDPGRRTHRPGEARTGLS